MEKNYIYLAFLVIVISTMKIPFKRESLLVTNGTNSMILLNRSVFPGNIPGIRSRGLP